MLLISISALPDYLIDQQRLLGLDVGTKTIGLALSDVGRRIATPMHTIKRTKFAKDAAQLLELCQTHAIGALIIGMPLNMNGSEGPRAQATRAFQRNLSTKIDLPMIFWDERLSSVAAERALLEADLSRQKRAKVIDATAAGIILQTALDRLNKL